LPFVHSVEQHWPPLLHGLPEPRHVPVLTFWQVPLPPLFTLQLPLQQSTLNPHEVPSPWHAPA
jgi:hypothetical protein